MNFQQTVDFLFRQLPVFQRQGKAAYKDNLDNTLALDAYFAHPHRCFKTIHVAGTNGKGSTSHMMASVLQQAGYKVGLYTSPHLLDMRERIKVNGQMMQKEFVVDFVADNLAFIQQLKPSFFELMVMMSFQYFKQQKVDVAIMEVGMGGRLDSTNIIHPEISVITNIGMDHTQFLGDTLEKIAGEKAGIIKAGVPVIIGEKQLETTNIFISKAKKEGAPITFAESQFPDLQLNSSGELQQISFGRVDFKTDLLGTYQGNNLRTAYVALQELTKKGFKIHPKHFADGFARVIKNTGLNGRWQVLQHKPLVVCDTAHNREGLNYVLRQIERTPCNELHIVLGMVSDKDAETSLQLFPKQARYYLCEPQIPRAMPLAELEQAAAKNALNFAGYASVKEAANAAKQHANANDFIFIGGSTFVVAEALEGE